MIRLPTFRKTAGAGFLACLLLLAYALYVQHVDFLDPCPLCIFQRVCFLLLGVVALIAAIHNPGVRGRRVYFGFGLFFSVLGAGIAGRHVWLQNLPADQVPACGPGLNYMIDTLPFLKVLEEVFYGSGECAEISWQFLGLSMPSWVLIVFLLFSAVLILKLLYPAD